MLFLQFRNLLYHFRAFDLHRNQFHCILLLALKLFFKRFLEDIEDRLSKRHDVVCMLFIFDHSFTDRVNHIVFSSFDTTDKSVLMSF